MPDQYAETLLLARDALDRTFEIETSVQLSLLSAVVDYPGAAAIVLRCRALSNNPKLPEILIVKRSMAPDNHLLREWSNLEFLSTLKSIRELIPKLYAGDEHSEILIMEDLEPGRELLGNLVEGHDPETATAGLTAFHRALGTLHGNTTGHETAFQNTLVRGDATATSRHVIHRTHTTLAALPDLLERARVPVDHHLQDELGDYQREIATPGPFHGFVHGDAAIGNVFYDAERGDVRLIDFESGAFRHVLLDGSYARMRYIYSVWARRMPLDLQRMLLRKYRDVLSEHCPEAADDKHFNRGLIACSAFLLAAILASLPSVTEQDRKRGRSTERQRIVASLDHFVRLSEDTGMIGPIATAAGDLARRLRSQWDDPDCTMRWCNAFQDSK